MCLRSWRWRSGKATSSMGLVTACAVESEPRVVLMRPHETCQMMLIVKKDEKDPGQSERVAVAARRRLAQTVETTRESQSRVGRTGRGETGVHTSCTGWSTPESGNRRIVCRLSDRAAVVTRRRRRVTSFTAALSRDRNRNAPGRRPGRRGGVRVPAAGCARSPVRRLGDVRTGPPRGRKRASYLSPPTCLHLARGAAGSLRA